MKRIILALAFVLVSSLSGVWAQGDDIDLEVGITDPTDKSYC